MSWGKGEAQDAPPLIPDTLIHTWDTVTFEPPKWLFPTMFTPTLMIVPLAAAAGRRTKLPTGSPEAFGLARDHFDFAIELETL